MKTKLLLLPLSLFIAALPARAADAPKSATPLQWSIRMADSEIARHPNPGGKPKWDYANSIVASGAIELSKRTGDVRFADWAAQMIGSCIGPDGTIAGVKIEDYSVDNIRPMAAGLALYRWTGDERYRKAADILRGQLSQMPRTPEGGFWHKKRYPGQMWLDGLYMAEPFYAEYARSWGAPDDFNDIAKQFLLIAEHTYDAKTGLFYHAWDSSKKLPWANKETGTSPSFWGRAVGWYAMAFADTLEYFPADHPKRAELIAWFTKLADGVVKTQDPKTGLWWQVMDQGKRPGNYLEASASSMFVYALAKGVNLGYLPRKKYTPAIRAGYEGIIRDLVKTDADGRIHLTQCCRVAGLDAKGRDGTFDYYTLREPIVPNDPKGVGPFILAGLQIEVLFPKATFAGAPPFPVGWASVPSILARIRTPKFPDKKFPITDFGAVGDGTTDCTKAIAAAIDACNAAGGGRVIVPPGKFLTGAIVLKSNVNLHVAKNATLLFSTDPAAYPNVFTRWEGVECYNYSPLIYARGQQNFAITGEGTLDGQAGYDNWWGWIKNQSGEKTLLARADRDALLQLGEESAPTDKRIFGAGHYLRPNFIQPHSCRGVLIEGVTIIRSPMWEVHPVLCSNVTVRNVKIDSHGPNNDGCDPESCRDVLIEGCTFDTGDDCIAIKSGRNNDGRRVGAPSENIIIRKCVMKDGHGGVTIGSEISGDCRNVFAEDCKMDSPNLDRALRLKTNAMRGGTIENIYMRKVEVGQVSGAVLDINFLYEEGANGPFIPVVRNVNMENVTSNASKRALSLIGFETSPIKKVRIANCSFNGVKEDDVIEHVVELEKVNVKTSPSF